jgi:membrane protease YdiL (CAAX protease family)
MIIALLMLYPMIKMSGLLPEIKRGLEGSRDRYRELGIGIIVGSVSIFLVYLLGWKLNVYHVHPEQYGPFARVGQFTEYFMGAVIVGIFEETFFRGLVFGAIRERLGFMAALILSSIFYSGIHFFSPLYPQRVEHASWNTGFAIIPYMFEKFIWTRDVYFAATLLLIGLTLAILYHKKGNLYLVIGLHGGWVLAQMFGSHMFDRHDALMPALFGHDDTVSKGLMAVFVISLFLLASIIYKPRKDGNPAGRVIIRHAHDNIR